jgi:hypothetical protein
LRKEQYERQTNGYALLFRDRFYARRHTAADDISGVATDAARTLIGSAPDNERVGIFTTGTP